MQHLLFQHVYCLHVQAIQAANSDKDSTSAATSSTAGSGDDMYYELLQLTTMGKNVAINGTTKMYISSKGDMRVESNTSTTIAGNKNSVTIVIIGHSDKPDESIILDD